MTPDNLATMLADHAAYLAGKPDGVRANLCRANLPGANLTTANLCGAQLLSANLSGANLSGAQLLSANLSGAQLLSANLTGANLTGANLTCADLSGANLTGADLSGANLTGAKLTGAKLYGAKLPPAPAVADLDGEILRRIESGAGTLEMCVWHACRTTHCRAGWAIALAGEAGEAGEALEAVHGPAAAGTLIYAASYPGRPIPDFYTDNASALDDIRRGAAT